MTDRDLLTAKIQSYLKALSPRAVETLVRGLERARQAGKTDPHLDLILAASAELLRSDDPPPAAFRGPAPAAPATRKGHLERLFFSPLDTFLVNEQLPYKQAGRVYRPYLNGIWQWLERDLLPADIARTRQDLDTIRSDAEKVHARVAVLRRQAADALGEAISRAEGSEREARRLAMVLGGDRAVADLQDVTRVLQAEPWLPAFLRRMPPNLTERRLKQDTDVLALVEAHARKHPDYVPVLAAAVLDRADAPWSLGTFATRLAGTQKMKDLAQSRFAPFVDMVVSEAERLNVLAKDHQRHNPDPVAFSEAVSSYATLLKGLELDLDLTGCDQWKARISHTRRDMSHLVADELQGASGAVRRALAVPKVDRDGNWTRDEAAVDAAVRVLRLLAMARGNSETLAVNEVSKRARHTVEQTLEILTRALISDLRKQSGPMRDAHLFAIDTAVLLAEVYFGPDYAAQIRRSRQAAVAATAPGPASAA
ncbi:hypothetical protein [Pannonibacter tanglangensis]|uniref:Uncharacterized protein n=1 Tax=Pannonibacter tanglangensis TaxID=2750084 RepID=A0ABW9ZDF6_9HYPH|nr:hypothetical protein [Pannonibacter sp. XCT-34]NBN62875.1 hypothetical protein [Pannonibacter sp. XCT-34]